MTLSRRLTSAVALLCVTGALAACGDDDEDTASSSGGITTEQSSGGGGGEVDIKAEEPGDEEYAFDPSDATTDAGSVTIKFDNPDGNQAPHAVVIEGNGVNETTETIEPGNTSEVTADLEPGEYTFYCPVGDHRADGMEGTLTVN